jgi:hypothetical protein
MFWSHECHVVNRLVATILKSSAAYDEKDKNFPFAKRQAEYLYRILNSAILK